MMDFTKFKQLLVQASRSTRTKSPEERALHAKQRKIKYAHRNATYPYDNHRQRERYGRQHDERMRKYMERYPEASQEAVDKFRMLTDRP